MRSNAHVADADADFGWKGKCPASDWDKVLYVWTGWRKYTVEKYIEIISWSKFLSLEVEVQTQEMTEDHESHKVNHLTCTRAGLDSKQNRRQ